MSMAAPENHIGRVIAVDLPSVHDGTQLRGHIHLPQRGEATDTLSQVSGGAIVAHPYAPLGGSEDDHVVQTAKDTLLEAGYSVCTFNFRGARPSDGRTSWTSKPELGDYKTVLFVFALFLSQLRLKSQSPNSPEQHSQADWTISIVIGGYSYGSMIASSVLVPSNLDQLVDDPSCRRELFVIAHGLVWGGVPIPESNGGAPAPSITIQPSYLLVSPILPPLIGLLSLGSGLFSSNTNEQHHLGANPTLIIWGDSDGFSSDKRLKKWVQSIKSGTLGGCFLEHESVSGVDHFWRTRDAQVQLRSRVLAWLEPDSQQSRGRLTDSNGE